MSHEAREVVRHEGHEVHEESTREGLRDLRGPQHRVLRGSSRGGAWPPLVELTRARIYEFVREPEAIFWAFVFPIAMVIALGIAFPATGESPVVVGVERTADGERIRETLGHVQGIVVRDIAPDRVTQALRDGQVHVVVAPGNPPTYRFDPTRAESRLARLVVDEALKRAAGRRDPWEAREDRVEIAGSRYVDWLIPGLLGMDIMSSGLWGIGFSIVQARVRKLLKRMVASPMRKRDYLLAQLFARLVFLAGEVTVLVAFGILAFGMPVRGSFAAITVLSLVGALSFGGLGLLLASRVRTFEAISGLINLLMLPMSVLSGVFFSSANFPAIMQPAIHALPLTALNDSLRAVMLEGTPLSGVAGELAIMAVWGIVPFALAIRMFKWS
jgi:ABC-type multidrug transport system permease subunit